MTLVKHSTRQLLVTGLEKDLHPVNPVKNISRISGMILFIAETAPVRAGVLIPAGRDVIASREVV